MRKIISGLSLGFRMALIIAMYSMGVVSLIIVSRIGFQIIQKDFNSSIVLLEKDTASLTKIKTNIDSIANTYQLIVAEKGANGLAHLKKIREYKSNLEVALDNMVKENSGKKWVEEKASDMKALFSEIDESGKQMTLGFLKDDQGMVASNESTLKAKIEKLVEEVNTMQSMFTDNTKQIVEKTISFTDRSMMLIGGIGLFVTLLLAIFLIRMTKKDLEEISEGLRKTSASNVQSSQNIQAMLKAISNMAQQQAASTQKTASALNEINQMANMSSENAIESSHKAKDSQSFAVQGSQAVDDVITSMKSINHSNEQFTSAMEKNAESMMEVVDIIKGIEQKTQMINDIVFQTKLLSFNASVEAARAGEHGKGFSVVAEEVGNLAQMSGNSAEEITQMLMSSTKTVVELVESTKAKLTKLVEDGKQQIQQGMVVAEKSGDVLKKIVSNVEEVNQLMESISQSSKEQADGVSHISTAIEDIDKSVTSNVKSIEVANKNVQQVTSEARALSGLISRLESLVNGQKGGPISIMNRETNVSSQTNISNLDTFKRAG